MAIWVTSDLHFNHPGILKMSRQEFHTVAEHNQYLITKYNSVVGTDDLVYILGDLGFKPLSELEPLVRQLNGRKILILGNHDAKDTGAYRRMGFIDVIDHPVYYSSNIILSHEPVQEALNNPYVFNIHGHLHRSKLNLPNFINVNGELHSYLPQDLKILQSYVQKRIKSRRETFQQEWYKDYYIKA